MQSGRWASLTSTPAALGFKGFAVGLCTLAISVVPTLAPAIEIVELQHRPASEMIPLVEPFLPESGVLRGQGFLLILEVPAEDEGDILQLIGQLDRAVRQLRISVRQGDDREASRREFAASARIPAGEHGEIVVGSNGANRSDAKLGGRGARVAGNLESTRSRSRDNLVQQVTTLEGRPAQIYVGVDVPIPESYGSGHGDHFEGVEYRQLRTGFSVLAQLRGEKVRLEISPQRESLGSGRDLITVQGMTSVVTGQLGQWLDAGAITSASTTSERGWVYSAGSMEDEERRIYFLVEEY